MDEYFEALFRQKAKWAKEQGADKNEYVIFVKEIDDLRASEAKKREALEAVEWDCDSGGWFCPWCSGRRRFNLRSERKHTPDCLRQLALKED